MRLENKVIIVTGGNRGIGKAIVLSFVREGASVAVVGRDQTLCEDVVMHIIKTGGRAISIQADVASEQEVPLQWTPTPV